MIYAFGDYELDTHLYELRHIGLPYRLEPQVFNLLLYLLRYRDRVVLKRELLDYLWPDQSITESALSQRIRAARKALGDDGRTQRYIKTLHGRGYRFVAAVVEHRDEAFRPNAVIPAAEDDARRCSACQHVNSTEVLFCVACGTRLVHACPGCAQRVHLPATFCPACGHHLEDVEPPATARSVALSVLAPHGETDTASHHALAEEHKLVTVLCCVLADAPSLATALGPETMHHLMQTFFSLTQRVVQHYEGSVVQFAGDGFLALFGAPIAHEDHAHRAVLAALELQQLLSQHPTLRAQLQGASLSTRMGLHTGLVVISGLEGEPQRLFTAAGDTTALATRLEHLAAPDTILVSEATQQLVQEDIHVESYGSIDIETVPAAGAVYVVRGMRRRRFGVPAYQARPLSPFVGRERELEVLQKRLADVHDGEGQVVGIAGEPGIGKSRLLAEFRRRLSGQPVTYCEGHCLSYGSSTPYLPVLDILSQLCGIPNTDCAATIATHICHHLQYVGMTPEEDAPYLLHLLGMTLDKEWPSQLSPQALKRRTFAILHQLILYHAQPQPLVIAVENLHWIDATSEEFFTSLVERLVGAPILLVGTYRPGYRPPWMDRSYVTQLALPHLALQDSVAVVRSVLPTTQRFDRLEQEIVAKAAGNPFFLEELARALVEGGELHATLPIPDTIQAVLAARIDRLQPTDKRLLQIASVIGKDVSLSLLSAVVDMSEEELHHSLDELKAAEFLYTKRLTPESVYSFKHVLIQEVAYQSLLTQERHKIHQRIAHVLC